MHVRSTTTFGRWLRGAHRPQRIAREFKTKTFVADDVRSLKSDRANPGDKIFNREIIEIHEKKAKLQSEPGLVLSGFQMAIVRDPGPAGVLSRHTVTTIVNQPFNYIKTRHKCRHTNGTTRHKQGLSLLAGFRARRPQHIRGSKLEGKMSYSYAPTPDDPLTTLAIFNGDKTQRTISRSLDFITYGAEFPKMEDAVIEALREKVRG
jgi:hypothetical protein